LANDDLINFTFVQLFEGDTDSNETEEDLPLHRMNPLQILLRAEEDLET
jgi:hypothetical protein